MVTQTHSAKEMVSSGAHHAIDVEEEHCERPDSQKRFLRSMSQPDKPKYATPSEEWELKILTDGEDPSAMRMLNPTGSLEET